jgi:dihydropyrimidine dehydrogenase (NAD+) subunit PreA
VEIFAVAVSCKQICTAVMLNGYQIITPLLKGLETYADRKGLQNLSEITGAALPKIVAREQLNMHWSMHSTVVAPEKCIHCAKCIVACTESGKAALSFVDKKVTVDRERCDGCSLCTHVCPQGVLGLS